MKKAQIIVHGGAWNENDPDEIARHNQACQEAVEVGKKMLLEGASALETVEKVIQYLEDVPFLDAGTGAHLQLDGQARLDASIMTDDLRFGSVLQAERIQHPISLARKILEYGYHSIIGQPGVNILSKEEGFPSYDLTTKAELDFYYSFREQLQAAGEREMTYRQIVENYRESFKKRLGTVGCVVRDFAGKMAVGTSTGGLPVAYPGRVGDSGLPGGGTYCNEFGGVSCTGDGEKMMIICLAKAVVDGMENGLDAKQAADKGIAKLAKINGQGGVICIDANGKISSSFNTSFLAKAEAEIEQ